MAVTIIQENADCAEGSLSVLLTSGEIRRTLQGQREAGMVMVGMLVIIMVMVGMTAV